MGSGTLKRCQFCGARLSDSDVFCVECGKPQREVRTFMPSIPAKPESKRGRNIFIAIFLVILVVVALSYGAYQATKPPITTPFPTPTPTPIVTTPTTVTTSIPAQERLVAQFSGPIQHDLEIYGGDSTPISSSDSPMFRPLGQSLKVVFKMAPTLATLTYSVELRWYVSVTSHDGVSQGGTQEYVDHWNFQGGSYISEKFINLKATNVDCYATLLIHDIKVSGVTGHPQLVANLEILIYDLT